jgi:Beta xylosidase C-terminal Concanavalin A-like domain
MNDLDVSAFTALFKEAHQKCFGHPVAEPLSETESKLFSNKIFDQTGLVIGPKSIKNYSFFILNSSEAKEENPSVATLDTMARFATDAPYTNEIQRKIKENHYPYWFQYKDKFYRSQKKSVKRKWSTPALIIFSVIIIISIISFIVINSKSALSKPFTDNFNSVADDTLSTHGWFIKSKDEQYWNKRSDKPGYLTLYTLKGDNWPDSLNKPDIKNLLLRKISADCFTVEIHLSEFIPQQNWQQAGILLSEDTNFSKKSLRLSFLYNDFYGGFPNKKEIIIQAITSQGKDSDKPEEIIHKVVFTLDSSNENLVKQNLRYAALRIERHGKKFRLLFANGGFANTAFKELTSQDIDMNPLYIGLFAIKGFVDTAAIIPAQFDFFNYSPEKCEK